VPGGIITAMNRTVLLVEDEEQVLRLIVKVLEMRGYCVLTAESGLQALALSEAHEGSIDLLLADVELDDMIGGQQLATILRRTRPRMRVLYTSGYPLDCCIDYGGDRIRKEIQELMAAFLPKPFTPSILTENVRRAFEDLPV
jgi:two-component system, cell cycle sensor histidine kinase and response regulator CckA